ncbi:RNA 2',3'-cyclic phosphodiesterase [Thermostilla marina]
MSKYRIRTFVAVDLDPAIVDGAGRAIARLRTSGADVKWVRPENMHLTLKFLGDVDARDVYDVCRAVQQAVAELPPFTVQVDGLGAFPTLDRPRVVWMGITEGGPQLIELADRVEQALVPLGFRREARKFRPHITLGRVRGGGGAIRFLADMLRKNERYEVGMTAVDEVVVYSSDLQPEGPVYKPLGHAELAGN